MFKKNIFQSKSIPAVTSAYPTVVQEIHNEFYSAGDILLAEANQTLATCLLKDTEKSKRLEKLGFKNVPQVRLAREAVLQEALSKKISELIMYYKREYPLNKFITHDKVLEICEKYSLVLGDISMFKGFVPEVNLKHIEMFKVKEKDFPFVNVFDRNDTLIGTLTEKDFKGSDVVAYIKNPNTLGYCYINTIDPEYKKSELPASIIDKYRYLQFVKVRRFESKLRICAPLKDMEIPEGKQLRGNVIQNIPDPVVLQPISEGYLIVTAWGPEASDSDVLNEITN